MDNAKNFLLMPDELSKKYKFSKYNLYIDEQRGIVSNTITQAVSQFGDYMINSLDLPDLLECGFVVPIDKDELRELEIEYESRDNLVNELNLIIAITLDCQFRCFYCYENHPVVYMKNDVKAALISFVEQKAKAGNDISVVWYGGEPLLDLSTMKELTFSILKICKENGVLYRASMISNGYAFDDYNIYCLDDLHIKAVQITLDGLEESHEYRRPMINGEKSFDMIISNMTKIYFHTDCQLHLRINVDKDNIEEAYRLVEYCESNGLEDIEVNMGLLKEFGCNHSCSGCSSRLLSMKQFADEFLKFKKFLVEHKFYNAVNKMNPEYKVNSCTMDAPNAYCIDPNGFVYKCISDVGQTSKCIGNVKDGFDENAHSEVSPFQLEICTKCEYFPICKGGCLKNNSGVHRECNIWKYITEKLILQEMELASAEE